MSLAFTFAQKLNLHPAYEFKFADMQDVLNIYQLDLIRQKQDRQVSPLRYCQWLHHNSKLITCCYQQNKLKGYIGFLPVRPQAMTLISSSLLKEWNLDALHIHSEKSQSQCQDWILMANTLPDCSRRFQLSFLQLFQQYLDLFASEGRQGRLYARAHQSYPVSVLTKLGFKPITQDESPLSSLYVYRLNPAKPSSAWPHTSCSPLELG